MSHLSGIMSLYLGFTGWLYTSTTTELMSINYGLFVQKIISKWLPNLILQHSSLNYIIVLLCAFQNLEEVISSKYVLFEIQSLISILIDTDTWTGTSFSTINNIHYVVFVCPQKYFLFIYFIKKYIFLY